MGSFVFEIWIPGHPYLYWHHIFQHDQAILPEQEKPFGFYNIVVCGECAPLVVLYIECDCLLLLLDSPHIDYQASSVDQFQACDALKGIPQQARTSSKILTH